MPRLKTELKAGHAHRLEQLRNGRCLAARESRTRRQLLRVPVDDPRLGDDLTDVGGTLTPPVVFPDRRTRSPLGAVVPRRSRRALRAADTPDASRAVVAGDVPHRRRLLLDARLSAEHRVSGRRVPVAVRDARARAADAVRRAARLHRIAALSPNGQGSLSVLEERCRAGAARRRALPARVRGHELHHHDHALAADATAHIIENPFVPRASAIRCRHAALVARSARCS
jgi:hypothetical protein